MLQIILQSLFLFLPAAVANMMPVLVKDIRFLRGSVDFGLTIHGKRVFGDHKTWRGFFFGILGAIATIYLVAYFGPKQFLVMDFSFEILVIS